MKLLFKNPTIVNQGRVENLDVLCEHGKIERIDTNINVAGAHEIDCTDCYLLPGAIDDQVHFREPGLVAKATIKSESKAALKGGVTSFMEMPNVLPPTLTVDLLNQKKDIAARDSSANYAFYLGAGTNNLEQIKALDPNSVAGLKIFMGSSTGDLKIDDPELLSQIFAASPCLIATHCEDNLRISERLKQYVEKYADDIPFSAHPEIRDNQACLNSSRLAIELAKRHQAKLHILHITTAEETQLFSSGDLQDKLITSEACIHHLWFCDEDYANHAGRIKCNPAIKSRADRQAVREAVKRRQIDVIATDHAPHLLAEKSAAYQQCPAGLPLIEYVYPVMMQLVQEEIFQLTDLPDLLAHRVAQLFQIKDRGYVKPGCYADLVLLKKCTEQKLVQDTDALALCGWSAFAGSVFDWQVACTMVNGVIGYCDYPPANKAYLAMAEELKPMALEFMRS